MEAELGLLHLALSPHDRCLFRVSPARSLHAALLRRLELLDPDLSQALHDAPKGAHASDHPWTVSPLLGHLDREDNHLVALPGRTYEARVTALVPDLLAALAAAFDPARPLLGGNR